VYLMAGDGGDAAYYTTMRAHYGLDRSMPEQYLRYVRAVASGDFGFSYGYQQPVFAVIRDRVPATLALSLPAFAIAAVLGLVVGLAGAAAPRSRLDVWLRLLASALYSAPVFWVGQILLLLFAVLIPIFTVGGMRSLRESTSGGVGTVDLLWHLVLPCASLTAGFLATSSRA
jgi:peptide/nickel transport system permease protein